MQQDRIVFFFLIDAMGWRVLATSGYLAGRRDLCCQPLETVLTYSSGAVPTILTGKYPSEHGRWNLIRYAPDKSPFSWTRWISWIPQRLFQNRYAQKGIAVISKRIAGAQGYFSSYGIAVKRLKYFDLCETRNIYKPKALDGHDSIFDHFCRQGIRYKSYSYHDGSDNVLFDMLKRDVQTGTEQVYFVYLANLDSWLHAHVDDVEGIRQQVDWYFQHIDEAVALAGRRAAEVRYFVFSDHGMTPIREHYDLIGHLRREGVGPESDYLSVFDSTMARFWIDDDSVLQRVRQALEQCPAGRVVDETELKNLQVFFPDGRYGTLIFLMNPGVLILPSLFGSYAPKGMHGYHPSDPHSAAAYVSNVSDHAPREIRDLFGIMLTEAHATQGATQAGESAR